MNRTRIYRVVAMCFGVLLWCFSSPPLLPAGDHSLSKWENNKFDLVVSLAWEPSAQDKTNLEKVFKLFAKDVYRYTQKKHQVRRLYVYTPDPTTNKAREWDKADIQLENSADAANATINGFTAAGGRIWADDDLSDLDEIGHALAHELGHYAYGLYDEYKQEQTNPTLKRHPGFPHKDDNPKDTIMTAHWQFFQFSVDEDYRDNTKRNTAQWRMYQAPAWQILTQEPSKDKLAVGFPARYKKVNKRYSYSDLQKMTEPEKRSDLSGDTTGLTDVEIIYMEGSEVCIVVDNSGSMGSGSGSKMESAKAGAKFYIDKLKDEDFAAVVKFSSSASTVSGLQTMTGANKTSHKSAIDGIYSSGSTNIGGAMRAGLNILDASTRKGTYKYIVLLTDGEHNTGESPTGAILTDLLSANIPVFAIGVGSGANMSTLQEIASKTNGKSYAAPTAAHLNAIYSDIQSVTSDDKLVDRVKDNLDINNKNSISTVSVDGSSQKAIFSASFTPGDTMTFDLTMPDGTSVTPSNVGTFPGITYTAESGYALYEVTNPQQGDWDLSLTAGTFVNGTSSDITLETKTDSDFSLQVEASGGQYPEPIAIAATVLREHNIKGLVVQAEIIDPAGQKSTLTLKDDGASPDYIAGDGVYTGILINYAEGAHEILVKATNPSGTAVETPTGMPKKSGSVPADQPVTGAIELSKSTIITTSGVVSDDHDNFFALATSLTADGSLVQGFIEVDNDTDCFTFTAAAGVSYTIFTSGLYPDDMETLVTLYDTDQQTVLESDKGGYDGMASKILWTAPADGDYYLVVEHGSPGTGIYSLGVRETQPSDLPVEAAVVADTGAAASTGGGGGGGCFIAAAAFDAGFDRHTEMPQGFRPWAPLVGVILVCLLSAGGFAAARKRR